jgi:HAMP domain-containing protein
MYWLFGRTFKWFNQANTQAKTGQLTQFDQSDLQKRVPEIIERLEILQKEQETLIQEMRSLLNSQPPTPNP